MRASEIKKIKQTALDYVDTNRKRLSDFHQEIWNYAEPAFREYKSAAAYVKLLREEGFKVEEGTGGMPTAFKAVWGKDRPILASYAEYDAVPGHSQKAVPYEAPRDGLHRMAAGHTDPHSSLGVGALFGILATKAAMETHNLKGTLWFFGEPAEKVCGSKPVHAAKGYFDGMDAGFLYHPGGNSVRGVVQSGAYWNVVFQFECIEPEDWFNVIGAEASARGGHSAGGRVPAALDAVCMMYLTTKDTKEAMLPHSAFWSLNEYILVGGQCTSDNIPPEISQISYAYRSPTLEMQETITRILENNAKAVARICFCKVYERWVTKTRVGLGNMVLSDLTYENFKLVGPPEYGEDAREFVRQIQRNIGVEPIAEPFTDDHKRITGPGEADARHWARYPGINNLGADDYVDYTWHGPCVRFTTARPALKPLPDGRRYPRWVRLAMGGNRSTIDPSMVVCAKVIGTTAVDLLTKPDLLKKAWDEFNTKTGGGIGGSKWVPPLLPKDFDPPVELRWPEYIRTARGEEWWIPTVKSTKEYKLL